MSAPDIKPCPFCGGEAQSGGGNSTYGRSWWTVWCNACEVELRDREVWDKARPGMLDPAYPAGECLDRWNTRAALPAADPLADPRVRAVVDAARAVNHDSLHGNGLEGFRKNRDRLRIAFDEFDSAAIQEAKP